MNMINRVKTMKMREEAKEALYSLDGCKHIIYGLCYATPQGNFVEQLADNSSEMRYFYEDASFNACIDAIYRRYKGNGCDHLNVYVVHRAE